MISHYRTLKDPASAFSSWSASLHQVFFIVKPQKVETRNTTHIAVMDTRDIDDGVFIWHFLHLSGAEDNREYLAFGCISGNGYRVASLSDISYFGLHHIFPELQLTVCSMSGRDIREAMFNGTPNRLQLSEAEAIKGI
jgi:hypothetical protein